MLKTEFALLATYGGPVIELEKIKELLGINSSRTATDLATKQRLPIPVFRLAGNKSPWCVHTTDLANYIDDQRSAAVERFNHING